MTIGIPATDANKAIRFEKGDPVEGTWYLCDRCFDKVRTETLIQQEGLHVCPRCRNKDIMEE